MNLKRNLLKILKNEVENFIKDNFKNEAFGGEKWKERKSKDHSDRNNPDRARRLLTKTGRLLRSIKIKTLGSDKVVITSDTPYASTHNEGTTINHPGGTPYITTGKRSRARGRRKGLRNFGEKQVQFLKKDGDYPEGVKFTKPHEIPIPQRQFIGKHKTLDSRVKKAFEKEIKRLLDKKFKR